MCFLKQALFLLLAGTCCPAIAQQSVHIIIKGQVLEEQGDAVAGVAVTDGVNIVLTNEKGQYTLPTTNEAKFVYITIPSGYEIPVHQALPVFYRTIEPGQDLSDADFILKRSLRSEKKHYTIVWADPQINSQEDADKLRTTVARDTRAMAAELIAKAPVQGIAVGDLSWDAPAIIPAYKEIVQQTGIPFFQVLGNHDMDIKVRTDERSDSSFRANMGPAWYSFNRGEAHYIVLDNVFYYGDGYNYVGYITEKQFSWLEQDLKYVKPGSLVFVAMHIPAYTEEKRRAGKETDQPGDVTNNRKFLYQLLKPFKAHIFSGHTHYNENRIEEGVYEHIHGAVCGTWWAAPLCGDGTPQGYAVYEINGDSVNWYYKSSGYPSSYQLRVYNKGDLKNKPDDIAVNVWNWDSGWDVSWYEDGVAKGGMRQETGYDGQVEALLTGPGRPAKYPWATPILTDHLFFATPSKTAKRISIIVTDRFGKIYKETILIEEKKTR